MIKGEDKPRLRSLRSVLMRLRITELRNHTMTPAELAEHRELEREMQADLDDYVSGDWTA